MDDKKDLERDAIAETQESADAQPRKMDLSAFVKAAPKPGDPLPEETEEERAKREADEKRLKEAIEKTFRLQEKLKAAIKTNEQLTRPIIESMQQMKAFADYMGKWASATRQERDSFYKFIDDNMGEICRITGETPETIEELKEYLFETWYDLLVATADEEEDIAFTDLTKPNRNVIYLIKDINLNLFGERPIETDKEEPISGMIEAAKIRQEEDQQEGQPEETLTDTIETAETAVIEIQKIIASVQPEKLDFPLDKPNSNLWRLLEETEGEQIAMEFDTTSDNDKRKGKEAIIFYGLDFSAIDEPGSGVTITKRLTPFDKLVYMAAGAFYNAGNDVFTVAQLYRMMGYTGRPGEGEIKKINDSLTKMTSRLYIDSTKEIEVNKNYPPFEYDGDLLPFERLKVNINNSPAIAIHLFREPPLITFARGRRQLTTISRALLMPPVNKTNENLYIQDYLIERIAHMRGNKKLPRKMLYKTIYENCNITTKKQKQRAPEKIKKFLDYYITQKFIKAYKESENADGIIIEI